jgi:cyclophilin family peptidyl-prolyl cis-trans isomerase
MTISRRIALLSLAVAAALPGAVLAQDKAAGSCAAALKSGKPVKVRLTTSQGPITLQLDREKAPLSVENFARYVDSGHYSGTIFHRVIDNFMVQGGGFTPEGAQKPAQAPIKNEAANGLKNEAYSVAMARTGVRDSATAQFFINTKDNDFLNYSGESPSSWGYAVFGKVVEGKETVDKIRKVPVQRTAVSEGQPLTPVVIQKAECL